MKMEHSAPKRRHIKFRRRGITYKKAYNMIRLFEISTYLKTLSGVNQDIKVLVNTIEITVVS
jgi:hypothetical protein